MTAATPEGVAAVAWSFEYAEVVGSHDDPDVEWHHAVTLHEPTIGPYIRAVQALGRINASAGAPPMTKTSPAAQGTVAPCPFCGSAAKMISCMGAWNVNGYEPDGRRIVCSADNCYGVGKPFYGDGMEEAATAWWNNRPASPSPEALPASGVSPWQPMDTAPKGYPTEDVGCRGTSEWFFGRVTKEFRKHGAAPFVVIRRKAWPHETDWECNGEAHYVARYFDGWKPLAALPSAPAPEDRTQKIWTVKGWMPNGDGFEFTFGSEVEYRRFMESKPSVLDISEIEELSVSSCDRALSALRDAPESEERT